MQTRWIVKYLAEQHKLGSRTRMTTAGPVVEINVGGGKAVAGYVPIDDDSDKAFADFLAAEARRHIARLGEE